MADFTIASRIGQGVGQNAFAGGGSQINPLNMMQLMQTMELQRAAEQRALAGEARAQALHGPALEAANLRVKEARLGLGAAERTAEDAETADKALKYTADNPDWHLKYNDLRKQDSKLWSTLDTLAQKKAVADSAKEKDRVTYDKARFDLNSLLAETMAAVAPTIKDQAGYERWLKPLLQNNPEIANSLPTEYSPENFGMAKSVVDRLRQFKVVRLPTGDDAVFDPVEKKFISTLTEAGPQPYAGPQPAPAASAKPQTVTFRGGMESLSDTGRTAAQNVMQAFPGARITSGLRTPERNAAVGGAAKSYHLTGDAIDVVPPAGMPMNVFAAQLQQQLGPQGYTVMYGDPGHLDHVHIQPGAGMNVPRQFNPSVAATDVAAGRQPMGMGAPAAPVNAMAPMVAAQLMQQNAMTAPQQTLPNIAPGLTQPVPAPAPAANTKLTSAQQAKVESVRAETLAREQAQAQVKREVTAEDRKANQKHFDDLINDAVDAYRELRTGGYLQEKQGQTIVERGTTYLSTLASPEAVAVANPERAAPLSNLEQTRSLLLTAMMGATGMTSSQLNSDKEMSRYLAAMSSPGAPVPAIVKQLNALSRRFGSGRTFTEADFGEPPAPKGRGKAGETPAAGKPQSLQEFLAKAKPLNPNASEADLKAYYERTYGVR